MKEIFSKYIDKIFYKKWIFGISKCDIKEVIRDKEFNPDIKWFFKKSYQRIYADPFFLDLKDGNITVLVEDLTFTDDYAKISSITFDKNLRQIDHKVLLDTKSHISYPFVFLENDKIYVFPEAKKSGKFSCYEYDTEQKTLKFIKDIINLPLVDTNIIRHNNKYWIFGTIGDTEKNYELLVFYSENLLGPYKAHNGNPVTTGLDRTRSAGNFIFVDGKIYRPTQNCEHEYGESITINRLTELNEDYVVEVPHMDIFINKKNRFNKGMYTIHTLNVMDGMIAVDGRHRTFSPYNRIKRYLRKTLAFFLLNAAVGNIVNTFNCCL